MAKKRAAAKKRTTQNSGTAAKRGRVENLTPWQPGQSGNPGGRPKSFAKKIRELCGNTDDFARLAEGFMVMAFGSAKQRKAFFGETVRVSAKDKLLAMRELRDSGPGRPMQTVAVQSNAPIFALQSDAIPDMSGVQK